MQAPRIHPPPLAAALGVVIALLGGCAPAWVVTVPTTADLPASPPALARRGPVASEVHVGTYRSSFGCTVRYEVHQPVGWTRGVTVLVAHGFLRDASTMRGWARHLASHGLRTVAVSFCNSTPFAGRHDRNALDLRGVADAVRAPQGGRVAYVGFSAGGLAALLAAADDDGAVAYLGLDAVDSGALAARAAAWSGPRLFLAGEPSACNADGAMLAVAAVIERARVVRIPNATHCHFEDPYAPACELLCGRVEPPEAAAAIRDAIRSLATAWLLGHAGLR
jgi:pimeloyl-ACP methyl ester carboxylesterase